MTHPGPHDIPSPHPPPLASAPTRPHAVPTASAAQAGWGLLALLAGAVAALAAGLAGGLVRGDATGVLWALPAAIAGSWVVLWWVLRRRYGWSWAHLGFGRMRAGVHLIWEIPLILLLGLTAAALLGTALGISPGEGAAAQSDAAVAAFQAPLWLAVICVACLVVLGPIIEEIIFRRLLFGVFLTWMPVPLAVLAGAVIFAAVHVIVPVMIYVVWLGLGTCVLYLRHRSLWAPISLHVANNALAGLVTWAALSA